MTDSTGLKGEGVRWDLSELYVGPDDARLDETIAEAKASAQKFANAYRGKIAAGALDGRAFSGALAEYESLLELLYAPAFYGNLIFAADTQDAKAQRLVQRAREAVTEISNLLVFFSLEVIALDDAQVASFIAAPEMAPYEHYIEAMRRFKPYTLSEKEEQLLNQKNLTGRSAFEQLYDELSGSLRFKLVIDGQEREVTEGEIMTLLRHPDGGLREQAFTTFLDKHAEHALVFTAVFNDVVLDHKVDCELRNYNDIVLPTHLANEVAPETVETMMSAVERHYPAMQEYFRLKAGMLGVDKLKNTDLYAPIASSSERIPFAEAQRIILDAFGSFSGRLAGLAAEFFEKRWIDAEVRPGKRGGAFCAAFAPARHPYVLCSYNGTRRDVSTVAHELGHGIHYALSRKQRLLNYDAPLVLAETASVFAEILLARRLLAQSDSAIMRRSLLCDLLEDMYGTVFRQTALTRFEIAAHHARRSGPLTADDISEFWLQEQRRVFGDSVDFIPSYRWGWTYISHFIHSRFYCYSYSFGELLTLALFQKYLDEGESFVPAYISLLEGGGAERPERALAKLHIDINSPDFWDRGFKVIEGFLAELRQMPS